MVNFFKLYKSYIIAFCITIIRYYDYALFGLSAPIIAQHFMPGSNNAEQMLMFFAIFSLSVLARPIGSLFFGTIGDMISRVSAIKISTLMAIISTSLVAILPSFHSIGWLSVIGLTCLRMIFLMSLAGEIDAIKIYIAEKINSNKRHMISSIVSFSSQIGVLIASAMYHLSVTIEFVTWAWRINFLIGGILGACVFVMRNYLDEDSALLKNKTHKTHNDNICIIIQAHKIKFIIALVVNGMLGAGYHFLIIFLGNFSANILGILNVTQSTFGNIILITFYGVGCLISGYIADRVEIYTQIMITLICNMLCILWLILYIDDFRILHIIIVFIVPFYTIPLSIKVQSLFPKNIRMRMFSLSHSIGGMIFSSTTPFICMILWKYTESFTVVLLHFLLQLVTLLLAIIYIKQRQYNNMFESE